MENISLTPEMLAVIPGIALVLQVVKKIPALTKISSWMPLISVGLGIVYTVLSKMGTDIPAQILTGIIIGVAASGGYDVVKKLGNPEELK